MHEVSGADPWLAAPENKSQVGKLPAFQFYPGDWMKDPDLRRCSPSARGIWMDMLCLMFECPERGVLSSAGGPWTYQEIAATVSGDTSVVLAAIDELVAKGVASRRNDGAIYSRRLIRDEKERQQGRARIAKFRQNGGGQAEDWSFIRVRILSRDNSMCAYCGKKAVTVDHIVPRSQGGTDDESNLVGCCKSCNQHKSNRTPEEAGMVFWHGFDKKHLRNISVTPVSEDEDEDEVEDEKEVEFDCKEVKLRKPTDEELVYIEYPKKVAKGAAIKAIEKALKRISSGEDGPGAGSVDDAVVWLRMRTQQFANSPAGQAGEYTPYPASWYNAKQYLDDETEWYRRGKPQEVPSVRQASASEQRRQRILANTVGATHRGFSDGNPGDRPGSSALMDSGSLSLPLPGCVGGDDEIPK